MIKQRKARKIGEVCKIVNGGTPDTKVPKYWGGKIQWITPKDMGKLSGVFVHETERSLTEAGMTASSAKLLPANSIILSSRAPIGHLAINTQPMATNQGCKGLVPEKGMSSLYIYYFLMNSVDLLNSLGTGTTFKELSATKLSEVVIPTPPYDEQIRIVALLDEASAAIAKTKENAERNLKNAFEIFESCLQSIDAERVPLGDFVNIITGKLDANAAVSGGQYPFFTCAREIYAIDRFAFDCEAILLAGNNAVGDFNVKHYKGKFNAYQRTYIITVKEGRRLSYRYLYYQLLRSLKELKTSSVGAGTKFLKLGMIKELGIALPSYTRQEEVVSMLDSVSEETKRLADIYQQKLLALEELKTSILQKAFNGELTGG